MQLNLPILEKLKDCQNILITGIGGGFDLFAGLPLYHELNKLGKKCVLANYSFTQIDKLQEFNEEVNWTLDGCPMRGNKKYCPEGFLSQILNKPVWALPKLGVVPTKNHFQQIIDKEKIDAIIMIDGGVDSLMHGDEVDVGTILEDTVSLAALKDITVPKILATIGFGTEIDDGLDHYFVLQNMAKLAELNALIGSCCLTQNHEAFQFMKFAYEDVAGQENHAESHITPRIIKSVYGNFESNQDQPLRWFIQPLMNIYWFWNAEEVIKQNVLIKGDFCKTVTFADVRIIYRQNLITRKRTDKDIILF